MDEKSKFSILIVDDEKSNLDVLNHILKANYSICVAKSGQAALKRAREDKPDLILLDVIMPDMNGFEVLAALKESNITCDIPVIFITALDNAHDEEKGFALGAVDYITKPFHDSIVKARVKTHLTIVKQIRTIEGLGMIDALTDIPNKRFFDNQIQLEWANAIREQAPISLLTIGLDNFKNDMHGQPQNDAALQTVAQAIQAALKRPTDLGARIGGEKFAVILPDTDLNGALEVADNIRANIKSAKAAIGGDSLQAAMAISIGAASIIPSKNSLIADFISMSDKGII